MLVDLSVLPVFVGVILVFLVPPGPDMAYMVAVGLEGGPRAALRAISGIATGMSVYAVAVALGLGEVADRWPLLLTVLKVAGSAYLLWLATATLRHARDAAAGPKVRAGRWYVRGLSVSLTNPKLMLFFLAVLPRFMGQATNTTVQMGLLGAVNVCTEFLLYGGVGLLAGSLHRKLDARGRGTAVLNYIAAVVYAGLALVIVVEVLG